MGRVTAEGDLFRLDPAGSGAVSEDAVRSAVAATVVLPGVRRRLGSRGRPRADETPGD